MVHTEQGRAIIGVGAENAEFFLLSALRLCGYHLVDFGKASIDRSQQAGSLVDHQHRRQATPALDAVNLWMATLAQGVDEISQDGDVTGRRDGSGITPGTGTGGSTDRWRFYGRPGRIGQCPADDSPPFDLNVASGAINLDPVLA